MDNETQGQSTPPAVEAPKKKLGIFGKLAALWKSGVKGKAICIVSALVILGIIGAFSDDEEGGGGGGDWNYTGEYFDSVFKGFPKDEGVVYQHLPRAVGAFGMVFDDSYLPPITVMQATKKGNLVELEDTDRVIWVETKRRYEDDEKLDQGYYIRRGSMEYETALGAEKRVPRYVELTDKGVLEKIKKQAEETAAEEEKARLEAEAQRKAEEEARQAQQKAEEEARKKAAEEAAEQGAYELDIPIKSLCGFKLGAPPSQVRELLQSDDGMPVQDLVGDLDDHYDRVTYRLAKPFRLFTHVTVHFEDNGVGKHLSGVKLKGVFENVSEESYLAEAQATGQLIVKKFDIELEGRRWGESLSYRWQHEKESIKINFGPESATLEFEINYGVIGQLDSAVKEARKTTIAIDANAGADDL